MCCCFVEAPTRVDRTLLEGELLLSHVETSADPNARAPHQGCRRGERDYATTSAWKPSFNDSAETSAFVLPSPPPCSPR